MKTMLQLSFKSLVIIICLISGLQTSNCIANTNKSFFNDPPEAICNSGAAQLDQDHDIPFVGSGSLFNWNNEGNIYPAQSLTVGMTGLLGRVDSEFTPHNIVFGGYVTLTIVDGGTPKLPQTVLATKTIYPTGVELVFILENPVPVVAGQQITLIFTGTIITPGDLVSEPYNTNSYAGGARWGTGDGGTTWGGPYGEDINFRTYILSGPTLSIGPGGTVAVNPAEIDGGSHDDITDPANLIFNVSPNAFDCNDLGPQVVTLTVTDEGGLTSSCVSHVTVNDINNYCCPEPTALCQGIGVALDINGEATITPEDIDAGSTATCGTAMLELDKDFFTCLDLGENTVTLTITDNNGNTDECTALVNVEGVPCGWWAGPDGINCPGGSYASYSVASSTFTLISEGCYNPAHYRATDAHAYTWTSFCNDGYFMAEVTDVDGSGWGGITMREGSGPSEKMVQIMIDRTNLTRREFRQTTGGTAFAHLFQTQGKTWLKIERTGSLFKTYRSPDGNIWELVSMANISMPACIEVGLITMNGAPNSFTAANFSNVMKFEAGALSAPPSNTINPNAIYESEDFSVFPNPSTGLTTIDLPSQSIENLNIQVFSSIGQLLFQKEIQHADSGQQTIDLSPYQNGIYLISIDADGQRFNKKVVLEKF